MTQAEMSPFDELDKWISPFTYISGEDFFEKRYGISPDQAPTVTHLYSLYPVFTRTFNWSVNPIVRLLLSRLLWEKTITHNGETIPLSQFFASWYGIYKKFVPQAIQDGLAKVTGVPDQYNNSAFVLPGTTEDFVEGIRGIDGIKFHLDALQKVGRIVADEIWEKMGKVILQNVNATSAEARDVVRPIIIQIQEMVYTKKETQDPVTGQTVTAKFETLLPYLIDRQEKTIAAVRANLPLEDIVKMFEMPSLSLVQYYAFDCSKRDEKGNDKYEQLHVSTPEYVIQPFNLLNPKTREAYDTYRRQGGNIMPLLYELLNQVSIAQTFTSIAGIMNYIYQQHGVPIYDDEDTKAAVQISMKVPELNGAKVNIVNPETPGQFFMALNASKNYAVEIYDEATNQSILGDNRLNVRTGFLTQPFHLFFNKAPTDPAIDTTYGLVHLYDDAPGNEFVKNLRARFYRLLPDGSYEPETPSYEPGAASY